MTRGTCLASMALVLALATPRLASANAQGVGLGVAAGVAYSNTELRGAEDAIGGRFAWGFFVDIPLLSTFYITPAAMLYDLDINGTKTKVTDVDLNFKFIVPIGDLRLGAGLTAGLGSGLQQNYVPHYGALGIVSYNLVANLDAFALAQYKRRLPDNSQVNIDDIHGFVGGMFHF